MTKITGLLRSIIGVKVTISKEESGIYISNTSEFNQYTILDVGEEMFKAQFENDNAVQYFAISKIIYIELQK